MWLEALEEYESLWRLFEEDESTSALAESDFMQNAALRFPETCDWIMNNAQFENWMVDPSTSHCYLHGIPGSGKTVLAAYIGKWFRQNYPDIVTLVFFCDSKDDRKSAADSIFRNLIAQLLHYYPHLIDHLALEMTRTGTKKVMSWVHLKAIFLKLLLEVDKPLCIVIDALDELNTLGQDVLAETMSKLGPSLPREVTARAFFTSRTRTDIGAKFSFCKHQVVLDRGPLDQDLRIFTSLAVDRSMQLQEMFASNPTFIRELKETLLLRSEGMFLLPKLLLQELATKQTMDQMRRVLHDIPPTLSEYYEHFIERIENSWRDFALQVLSWLACALRPLSLEELKAGLDARPLASNLGSSHNLASLKFSLEMACSCFVIVRNGRVHLAHSSIKRYLLQAAVQERQHSGEHDRLLKISETHEDIALVCLTQLSSMQLSMPLSCGSHRFSTQSEVLDDLKVELPFLSYACQSWHTHLGLGGYSEASRLLEPLTWFIGSVNFRSYLELVFSWHSTPAVTVEDVSNTLISFIPKGTTNEDECFIFECARDLWDLNETLSYRLELFPSEVHFMADLLPRTAIYDSSRIQRSIAQLPDNLSGVAEPTEVALNKGSDASGQSVETGSDRFLLTESAMIDWESTMSTPSRYYQGMSTRWNVTIQNLETQKRYSRYSLSLCRREGICCSVAVSKDDQHIAVSWPEYQDDDATLPLKIKTYAWSLRWDEARSAVWRKWAWTDRQYGADYTRAAAFRGTKMSVAFTDNSETLATPGGFYNVSTGTVASPPELFFDPTISGLTFSSNADYTWGSTEHRQLIVYQRDCDEVTIINKEPLNICSVLAVAPHGTAAIILVEQEQINSTVDGLKLCLVSLRAGRSTMDSLYNFDKAGSHDNVSNNPDYVSSFYASGGQIHISETGKTVVALPSPDRKAFKAISFSLAPYARPAHTMPSFLSITAPENSILLSLRFQRGTGHMYGLTDQASVYRFMPREDSDPQCPVWETRMVTENKKTRNYLVSYYDVDSQVLTVALRLG